MRYLTRQQVLFLHQRIIAQSGGSPGVRSLAAIESALAQPLMTFDGEELYPTLIEKAAALGFSLDHEPSLCRWEQAHRPCRDGNVSGTERL